MGETSSSSVGMKRTIMKDSCGLSEPEMDVLTSLITNVSTDMATSRMILLAFASLPEVCALVATDREEGAAEVWLQEAWPDEGKRMISFSLRRINDKEEIHNFSLVVIIVTYSRSMVDTGHHDNAIVMDQIQCTQ